MSPLHMISLSVDLQEMRRLGVLNGLGADEGRALHHFLGETFGKGVIQPFRLMPGRNGSRAASLYGYTRSGHAALMQSAAETGPPESAQLFDLGHLAVKTMPITWSKARRLAFDVRIRPVKRLLKPLEASTRETRRADLNSRPVPSSFKKGAEVDAFLVAKLRDNADNAQNEGEKATREEVYRGWLAERLKGADLDSGATRMVSCNRVPVLRRSDWTQACDVVFHGEMTVTNPNVFQEVLEKGVGRHAAYGYGMLLLRPARK